MNEKDLDAEPKNIYGTFLTGMCMSRVTAADLPDLLQAAEQVF